MSNMPAPQNPIIVGDFSKLDSMLESGKITQHEYDKLFAESRLHGLDGNIWPFAIGGSDSPKIMGLSAFGGPKSLFLEKTGAIPKERITASKQIIFDIGHVFEAPIRSMFTILTGLQTEPCPWQVRNPNWPHCLANSDGIVWEVDEHGNRHCGIWEGKTARFNSEHAQLFKANIVPDDYMCQVQFYLEIWNMDFAWIHCAWGLNPSEMRWIRIERDREIGVEICQACENFVNNAIYGIMPSNHSVQKVQALIHEASKLYSHADVTLPSVNIPSNKVDILLEAERIDSQIAALKKQRKPIDKIIHELERKKENLLIYFAEDLKTATSGSLDAGSKGVFRVEYPKEKPVSFNQEAKEMLKKEFPEAWDELKKSYPGKRKISYQRVCR